MERTSDSGSHLVPCDLHQVACSSIERGWPLSEREQIPELGAPSSTEDDLGIEVGRVHLPDELTAPSTGRDHVQDAFVASPHRYDLAI